MKWILLFALSMCSFFAQADKCKTVDNGNRSGVYTFKPLTMTGTLAVKDIETTGSLIECENTQNVKIYVNAGLLANKTFYFSIGSQFYRIDFSSKGKYGWNGLDVKLKYNLEEVLSGSGFSLDYAITAVSAGGSPVISPGVPFPLVSEMEVKVCQGNESNCATTTFKYTLNITLQVNLMTCGFNDQSLDMGEFSLLNINREPYKMKHLTFNCKEGARGLLNFQPADIIYYFEPVSGLANGTTILRNEMESDPQGAGQIGFQLSMDNIRDVTFSRMETYNVKSPQNGEMQVPIYIRPRAYGSRVSAGVIKSKARVIVVYN